MNSRLLRSITPDEIDQYIREGVVWLERIIDPVWTELLARAIANVQANPPDTAASLTNLGLLATAPDEVRGFVAGKSWIPDNAYAAAVTNLKRALSGNLLRDERVKTTNERRGHFFHAGNVWRHDAGMRRLAGFSPLPEIAATLMASRRVYLYGDQVLVKPPLTMEKTAWHQDLGYGNYEGHRICAVRVPCDRETMETGAVGYVRGSHRSGAVYKVNMFISNATSPDDGGDDLPPIGGHEEDYDILWATPAPGDVVVHHIAAIHGAGGNCSAKETRRAVTIRYAGDDVRYKVRAFAPPQDLTPNLSDDEPLANDTVAFPRVWPAHERTISDT